jgi:hypothetical protein
LGELRDDRVGPPARVPLLGQRRAEAVDLLPKLHDALVLLL